MRFEWDEAKAEINLKKHGVSFAEAETVFGDALARIFDDEEHSFEEGRNGNCRTFKDESAFNNQFYRKRQ